MCPKVLPYVRTLKLLKNFGRKPKIPDPTTLALEQLLMADSYPTMTRTFPNRPFYGMQLVCATVMTDRWSIHATICNVFTFADGNHQMHTAL